MSQLQDRVRSAVALALGLCPEEVSDTASSLTITAWDSLGQLYLVTALQEEFGIEFTPEDMLVMESLEAICSLLRTRNIR
jgi:acyl carrier protein